MTINTQYILKTNPELLNYLRYHSYWYKILTRNPYEIENLKREYKDYKRQERFNKITKTLENLELLENIISLKK